ncbi:MAG: flagellar hook-basal body complex protein [Alphaproteobacteria bacterium]
MSVIRAFHVAKTGLQLQETHLAIKAQNMAAQGVDGYKKQYLISSDLAYQDLGNVGSTTSDAGNISPTGIQVGLGVQPLGIHRVFTEGNPINSENPLDVMIEGDGFLAVTLPDGSPAYTRIGALQLDANNTIVMPKTGYQIAPGLTLPTDTISISINPNGQVYARIQGQVEEELVGQLELATFFNPSGLRSMGDSLFIETPASGVPDIGAAGTGRRGTFRQGWREGSNVSAVEEVTALIQIEKIYEMLTKVIKAGDAMLEATNRIGR